jgi:hypothetical protein
MGPMSEIARAFDHLLTQLALVGFRVKVLKCKFWNPSKIFLSIEIPQGCTLVINGFHILDVFVSFQDFATHFLDEILSQDVVHIDDLFFLGDAQVTLGILSSCVIP